MCEHNATVASSIGRMDLMQAWQLAALTATSLEQSKADFYKSSSNRFAAENDDAFNWTLHPFGSNMIQAL